MAVGTLYTILTVASTSGNKLCTTEVEVYRYITYSIHVTTI